MYQIHYYTIR